jgi:photosystem II stability/assembly factor-like uncharacterized protein
MKSATRGSVGRTILLLLLIASIGRSQWRQTNGPSAEHITSFAVKGVNRFAGSYSGVFLSTNSGNTWTRVNTGLTLTDVRTLAVCGSKLFAASYNARVCVSSNNGSRWAVADSGLNANTIYSLAVIGANIFAGTDVGVFLSTNNGTYWAAVNAGFPPYTTSVTALAVTGDTLWAGTYDKGTGRNGLFLTTGNATSWINLQSVGLPWYYTIASIGANGGMLFLATNGGVFRSKDGGTHWTAVNEGLADTLTTSVVSNGAILFAGTSGGVFLSTNNGDGWTATGDGLHDTLVTALVADGTNVFAGTGSSGLFRTTDNGTHWEAVNTGLSSASVRGFAVSGATLFAGSYGDPFNGNIFRSSNEGVDWLQAGTGMNGAVTALAGSGTMLFAGTKRAGVFPFGGRRHTLDQRNSNVLWIGGGNPFDCCEWREYLCRHCCQYLSVHGQWRHLDRRVRHDSRFSPLLCSSYCTDGERHGCFCRRMGLRRDAFHQRRHHVDRCVQWPDECEHQCPRRERRESLCRKHEWRRFSVHQPWHELERSEYRIDKPRCLCVGSERHNDICGNG